MTSGASDPADISARLANHQPASLFGVLHGRSLDRWTAEMVPGEWMTDGESRVLPGSLGVLIDVGLSMPVFLARVQEGVAPVTTSLSIDILPGIDWSDGRLRVESELVHRDDRRGISRGEVLTGSSRTAAIVTLVGRYLSSPASVQLEREPGELRADPELNVPTIFGGQPVPTPDGARVTLMPSSWMANPHDTMHGGMIVTFVDLVGVAALDGGSADWSLSSMHISYVRPVRIGRLVDASAFRLHQGREHAVARVELRHADDLAVTAHLGYRRRTPDGHVAR